MSNEATTAQVARAIKVGPRTKQFVFRDADGFRYEGRRAEVILAALSRCDITPDLSTELHTVAYALRKSITSARMSAEVASKICEMTPWQVCGIVARLARECPETTTGGICDNWLPKHQHELVA